MARSISATPKAKRRCKSKTKAGTRCRAAPLKDDAHCIAHTRKDEVSQGFGGPQRGSGRPPKPRVTDLLRERAAGRAEVIDAIYDRAMTEPKLVAKYEGEVHVSDVDDLGAMLNAVERYLDRIEGKPRQAVELAASETGDPLAVIVARDDPAVADAAREFLAKLIPDA